MASPNHASAAKLKEEGNQAFKSKEYGKADSAYSDAMRLLAPPLAEAKCILHVNRAAARLKLGDWLGALEDTDAALQLDARRAKAWYRKASALQELGLWDAALEAAKQCLACSDSSAQQEVQQLIGTLQQQAQDQAAGGPPFPARLPVTATCLPPPFSKLAWEYVPACDGLNENLLILFHGLGDSPGAFARLARQMQLPQTAALAIAGPLEVPFTAGGRAWFTVFDDEFELIQGQPGEARRLHSLEAMLDALQRLLRMLRQRGGWPPRSLHLLGFSQGGTVALELAMRQAAGGRCLGSCVAISAALLEERMAPPYNLAYSAPNPSSAGAAATGNTSGGSGSSNVAAGVAANTSAEHAGRRGQQSPHQTPVLITHGTADAAVPRSVVERSVHFLRGVPSMGDVQLISLPGKGHGMVEGKTEMGELMRFWSRHLSRRPTAQDGLPGVPGGDLIEVRPGEISIEQLPEGASTL